MFTFSGDDPKLSDGTCNTSRYAQTSATTSVATLTATIKLAVKQLLDNALKYSPPDTPVTVRVQADRPGAP